MKLSDSDFDRLVRKLQWVWMGGAMLLIGGVVTWIVHLILTALWLEDVPSASIGISLVAIPIFLVFSGVVIYVFWNVTLRGEER